MAHLPHLAVLKHLNMKQGLLAVLWPEKETMKMESNISTRSTSQFVHGQCNETEQITW